MIYIPKYLYLHKIKYCFLQQNRMNHIAVLQIQQLPSIRQNKLLVLQYKWFIFFNHYINKLFL